MSARLDPRWYERPAGAPTNDAVLWMLRHNKYKLKPDKPEAPAFLTSVTRRPRRRPCDSWNPVMWSSYPARPAHTAPLPPIPGPAVTQRLRPAARLPCHVPPTETLVTPRCPPRRPAWLPDPVPYSEDFNPFENEQNRPFGELQGPPRAAGYHRFPSC